jgi:cytochrome c553
MNRKFFTVVSLVLVLMIPSLLMAGGDAEAGKATYMKRCKMCHAADGTGNAKMAKMLKVEIKDLGSEAMQALSDEEIAKVVAEGKGKMKPVKGAGKEDVANIIAFIRTLKK